MKIAVLTLTRDRLEYTKHCFDRLHELAGVDFDHYVLDQGSGDGTADWLLSEYQPHAVALSPDNIGISRGLNRLLDGLDETYDVVVKFDNDCELTVPGTLNAVAETVAENPTWILSPRILGLNNPVPIEREVVLSNRSVGVIPIIGGIFLAAPGTLYNDFRHNPTNPVWGMDDANLGSLWRSRGNNLGYLLGFPANHYETTKGQEARYPEYWERKMREFRGR